MHGASWTTLIKLQTYPSIFFKLILSSKYLICVLFNVYLNKKEMNNFYKFGQNSLSNYQIWQCYILFTKALKMMFQKLKSLFLKTWLLTKVFKRRWNITNSKLQTTPGFEGIKQLERLKTWSPALTMICGMLKENPS